MKKRIALAVLATIAGSVSTAAMADDNGDNGVTLYGYLRAGVVNLNGNGNSAWAFNGAKGNSASTNVAGRGELDFKGSEGLDNGLSTVWEMSTRFSPTGSAYDDQDGNYTGLANYDTFVGLKSNSLGQLVMGRRYTNFDDGKYDYTFAVGPDQIQGWFGNTEDKNMVRYDLPSFAGVHASVQYANGENAGMVQGTNAAQQNTTFNVNYDNGILGASASYAMANDVQTGTFTSMNWANNGNAIGTLAQSHVTAMVKPTDALQFAVEYQRNTLNGNAVNSSALYAYYTVGAVQFGMQGGIQTYSGNTPVNLTRGKFYDAFMHYNLSKATVAYVEVMDSKGGALSYSIDSSNPSSNRVMTDIGLSKSF
jgi:predicted porin